MHGLGSFHLDTITAAVGVHAGAEPEFPRGWQESKSHQRVLLRLRKVLRCFSTRYGCFRGLLACSLQVSLACCCSVRSRVPALWLCSLLHLFPRAHFFTTSPEGNRTQVKLFRRYHSGRLSFAIKRIGAQTLERATNRGREVHFACSTAAVPACCGEARRTRQVVQQRPHHLRIPQGPGTPSYYSHRRHPLCV